jgi:hypothetical protein
MPAVASAPLRAAAPRPPARPAGRERRGQRVDHRPVARPRAAHLADPVEPGLQRCTQVRPVAEASPAAAKKIASSTPDDPPIVWLSSAPIAR